MSELSINPGIEIRDSERELQRFRGRLAMLGRTLHIWNSFPESASVRPDVSISGYRFQGGDGGAVVAAGDRLYLPEYNGNRIAVYNAMPGGAGDQQRREGALVSQDHVAHQAVAALAGAEHIFQAALFQARDSGF